MIRSWMERDFEPGAAAANSASGSGWAWCGEELELLGHPQNEGLHGWDHNPLCPKKPALPNTGVGSGRVMSTQRSELTVPPQDWQLPGRPSFPGSLLFVGFLQQALTV